MAETRVLLVRKSTSHEALMRDLLKYHGRVEARNGWKEFDHTEPCTRDHYSQTIRNYKGTTAISECRLWLEGNSEIVMMLYLKYCNHHV